MICLRSSRSVSRSISTWIQDSTSASCGSVRPWPRSSTSRRRASPAACRSRHGARRTCGWIDQVDAAALAGQLLVTESTRNGMSSVTTSTTEWLHVQPFSSTVGVCTRTFAVPWGRVLGEPVVGQRRAEDVDRVAVEQVLRCACAGSSAGGTRSGVSGLGPWQVAPRPGCSQRPGRPVRAARPWLRPAWSALSSGSCRAPLRDVGGGGMTPRRGKYGHDDGMPDREMAGAYSAVSDQDPTRRRPAAAAPAGGVRARSEGLLALADYRADHAVRLSLRPGARHEPFVYKTGPNV